MRRVYRVRALRPFVSGATFAFVLFVFTLWGIGREVWVAQVFANAPHASIAASFQFFLSAFEHTRATVQALSVAAFFSMLWFFRDVLRVASVTFSARRA